MSAQKPTARGALSALGAFIGMSVVAGLLVTAAVTPAIAVTGMAANNGIGAFDGLPEFLDIGTLPQVSTIYATQGGQQVPIATFYSQNRVEVGSNDIAQVMKDAAISTEDPRFYEHGGIDVQGTFRAIVETGLLHKSTSGGSSITQQYVKNVKVQQCEKQNIKITGGDEKTLKKRQQAQDDKYMTCYNDATAPNVGRKVEEMKQAIGLEKKYSKNEILNGYLNIAGFGGSVYGVESAARYYFGATAKTLTLPQAATLVAILNNPANLRIDQDKATNPSNNADNGFKLTLDRRNYVFRSMLKNHKITQKQYDEAVKTKIEPKITPQPNGCETAAQYNAAYYCDWVQHLVTEDTGLGKTAADRDTLLRAGGLKIYTPLNLDIQAVAQQSLSSIIPSSKPGISLGASNLSVEVGTGRVISMVQNTNYTATATDDPNYSGINYNTDYDQGGSIGFQTGSTYKLFTLLEWLKEGHSINDLISAPNGPVSIPASKWHTTCPDDAPAVTWPSVGNDGPGEGGTRSVAANTAASVNTAFAEMGTKLDLCGIRQTAINMGIHTASPTVWSSDLNKEVPNPLQGSPATILGTNNLSPLTLVSAYAGVANGGKACTPVGIDKIVGSDGKELPVTATKCTQGVDPNVAAGAIQALQGVVRGGGTGSAANPGDGVPLFGKTGTTDHAAQNWFVSSTTKTATVSWVGQTIGNSFNFGNTSFAGHGGRDAKLYVARPVIAALNHLYGGGPFPQATGAVLQAKQIAVPDLTGKSPADAQSTLEGLGLQYQDGGPVDSAQPAGTVAKTDPGAGSNVAIGGTVTVYTSKGNMAAIPDVTGKTVAEATVALMSAGFSVQQSGNNDPTAIVTATDPPAGTPAQPGTKVKLTVDSGGGGKSTASPNPGNG
ncbi:PASTA domain-containing protein [Planctomonas sp. JC2975]|uniref:transglycosylase domain-containing protein n=1 Tax=Planctomonas sp. JC2975 TaxID=2729626 RepID=UPI0014765E19|nr:transglycosylase domain-containing protein [Planctomonas sp. JC2975]NNC12967.1 PASTA domain-containing protein [Planctomonas sp. JC2975]